MARWRGGAVARASEFEFCVAVSNSGQGLSFCVITGGEVFVRIVYVLFSVAECFPNKSRLCSFTQVCHGVNCKVI